MNPASEPWDYLIVTASNEAQAAAYDDRLATMARLGLLAGVRQALVVPDPGGRRVGSGGSTVHCLLTALGREPGAEGATDLADRKAWREALRRLRILIVHGGGDSTRLPAYGPCGKVFVPVPGESDSALGPTVFGRQLPTYLALPPAERGQGQVVIAAGDVLLTFDPAAVRFATAGITGLGALAPPDQASRHGVYGTSGDGEVRLFLQKPTPREQAERGAVDRYGRSVLDIGVFSFDAATAVRLLELCEVRPDEEGRLVWSGPVGEAIDSHGLDFYRELCCAMGTEATREQHAAAARASGSAWDDELLGRVHEAVSATPFRVQVLPHCGFLHFGTTRQLITSGIDLLRQDRGVSTLDTCVTLNTEVSNGGRIVGANAWVEGCRVRSTLTLGGENVVVGLDVDEALSLPRGACLDVLEGREPDGDRVWFVRCYGIDDQFKDTVVQGATFCGQPVAKWLSTVGAEPADVWDDAESLGDCRVWDARLFPAEATPAGYHRWLWMLDAATATAEETSAWLAARRYSLAEIAKLADHGAFHERRARLRAAELRRSLRRLFRNDSGFSAADLACVLARSGERAAWAAELLREAQWHYGDGDPAAPFAFSRIIHTLASALRRVASDDERPLAEAVAGLDEQLDDNVRTWLDTLGLSLANGASASQWASGGQAAAFEQLANRIVSSHRGGRELPRSALRRDEIVWGRAPARLDVGGGWTDTPPYSLEHGGCVINA
ncbi:MAG: fucose pyrophosphorylase domain-containing protein, partial [Planctomycetota bacterium]